MTTPAVAILAGGLLSAGYTADPGWGVWLSGEVHGEIFSGALEARVLPGARAVREPDGKAFTIGVVSGALVPCARWWPSKSVGVLGCAVFDVGAQFAGGGVNAPSGGSPVVATIGLGPRLAVQFPFLERFAFRLFADLRFGPAPTHLDFVGAPQPNTHWESPVASGLFGAGFSFE